jgi:hypothetical protein
MSKYACFGNTTVEILKRRMHMKKIIIFAFMIALAFSLCACACSKEAIDPVGTSDAATEPTTDTTDATDHTTPDDSSDGGFPWWIFAITSGVEAIIIVFLLLKKKH